MKSVIFCLAALVGPQWMSAQTGSTALVDSLVTHWQTSKDLTLAVANAMPDEGFAFKATDAQMSFGGQMNHIAEANSHYCSAAFGEKSTFTKPSDDTKATAIKSLDTAFDYCISGLKKMTDADLPHTVNMHDHPVSKFELLWGGFTHTAHHRGQTEVYLRLKGITPPPYKF
jgi:uncharacterized damage-inducible protein DinB